MAHLGGEVPPPLKGPKLGRRISGQENVRRGTKPWMARIRQGCPGDLC